MRATKEQILGGGKPEPFAVPALDAEVLIRPLSASEAEAVQAAQVQGIKAKAPLHSERPEPGRPRPRPAPQQQDVDLDLAEVVKGSHKAQQLAAHYGLVEPAMSLTEVQGVRPQTVVEQIGEEVMSRSGLGKGQAEQLQRFRELTGGPVDPEAAPGGEPADGDAG